MADQSLKTATSNQGEALQLDSAIAMTLDQKLRIMELAVRVAEKEFKEIEAVYPTLIDLLLRS